MISNQPAADIHHREARRCARGDGEHLDGHAAGHQRVEATRRDTIANPEQRGVYKSPMRRVARDVLAYLYRWRAETPELLMLRRAPDRGDFWHWVSGAPLPRESDREAAIREVLEETGLDVAATIFPLGYRYAYPLRPGSSFTGPA